MKYVMLQNGRITYLLKWLTIFKIFIDKFWANTKTHIPFRMVRILQKWKVFHFLSFWMFLRRENGNKDII